MQVSARTVLTAAVVFAIAMGAAREEQGITLRQLAKRLGKHATPISRIEDSRIAVATPDYFMNLVETLNLDIMTAVHLLKPYQRICDSFVNAAQKGGSDE
jgi:transcriptional regulator with XRE-family HTH domain